MATEIIPSEEIKTQIVVSDEEAKKILRRNGLSFVGKSIIGDLSKLGIYTRGIGITHTQTGAAIMNQTMMLKTMQAIAKKLKKKDITPEEMALLSNAHSKLAESFTRSQELATGGRREDAPLGDEPPPLRRSFAPGEIIKPIQVNVQVNNGNGKPPEVVVEGNGIAKPPESK